MVPDSHVSSLKSQLNKVTAKEVTDGILSQEASTLDTLKEPSDVSEKALLNILGGKML